MNQKAVADAIEEMVRRIVAQFHPKKIVLFGSHARGAGGPDSDVDLLVVMRVKGSNNRLYERVSDTQLAGRRNYERAHCHQSANPFREAMRGGDPDSGAERLGVGPRRPLLC
jgi:DNA polymerase sigma